MLRLFSVFRYISLVAIISTLFGSLLMFVIGATKTYSALTAYFVGNTSRGSKLDTMPPPDVATAYLIKSLDAFLIALVLFIFSYGVYRLFIASPPETDGPGRLEWINIPSIGHLKHILAEIIIVILFVQFLEVALLNLNHLSWELLTLPLAILSLSLGLKFMALRHEPDESPQTRLNQSD